MPENPIARPIAVHWIEQTAEDEPAVPRSVMAKWRWYRTAATRSCRWAHRSEVVHIVLAALAPLVTVVVDQPVAGAALGTAAVIVAGVRSSYRWQENWISRSRARYAIERHVTLYKQRIRPYDTDNPAAVLVHAVEDVAESEGQAWESDRRALQVTQSPPTT
ncbi:DUF4231 domain-containing protein [Actinokineospora sp. 24-640]